MAVSPGAVAAAGTCSMGGVFHHFLNAFLISTGHGKTIFLGQKERKGKPVGAAVVIRSTAFNLSALIRYLGHNTALHFMNGVGFPGIRIL